MGQFELLFDPSEQTENIQKLLRIARDNRAMDIYLVLAFFNQGHQCGGLEVLHPRQRLRGTDQPGEGFEPPSAWGQVSPRLA